MTNTNVLNARQAMMQAAADVNELRLCIKVARGARRAELSARLAAAEPKMHAAQRAYLAATREAK